MVGKGVLEDVGVGEGPAVLVGVEVFVGFGVRDAVGVGDGPGVCVLVGVLVGLGVLVEVGVYVIEAVGEGPGVMVFVGVLDGLGVFEAVGVLLGVLVGRGRHSPCANRFTDCNVAVEYTTVTFAFPAALMVTTSPEPILSANVAAGFPGSTTV